MVFLFLRHLRAFKQGRAIFPLPPFHALASIVAGSQFWMIATQIIFATIFAARRGRWVRTIQIVDGRGIFNGDPTATRNGRIILAQVIRMDIVFRNPHRKILFQQFPFFDAMAFGWLIYRGLVHIGWRKLECRLGDEICAAEHYHDETNTPEQLQRGSNQLPHQSGTPFITSTICLSWSMSSCPPAPRADVCTSKNPKSR